MSALAARQDRLVELGRTGHIAKAGVENESQAVPGGGEARLHDAGIPDGIGRRTALLEGGGIASGRDLDAARLGQPQRLRFVEGAQRQRLGRAPHDHAERFPLSPLGIAELAGQLGEGEDNAHPVRIRPGPGGGEALERLLRVPAGPRAVARPGGQRPAAVTRDEDSVAGPPEGADAREGGIRIAVQHEDAIRDQSLRVRLAADRAGPEGWAAGFPHVLLLERWPSATKS